MYSPMYHIVLHSRYNQSASILQVLIIDIEKTPDRFTDEQGSKVWGMGPSFLPLQRASLERRAEAGFPTEGFFHLNLYQ